MEFINLKAQYKEYKEEINTKIAKVLESSHFILGEEVEKFETEIAKYVGRKYAVACSDGTAALQLACMAYGIGAGDAVFCPDMTFIASVEPACLLGATPVFCDIDKKSYNIDIHSLQCQIENVIKEGKLTPKAIVAVDFVGNPIDYHKIKKIAEKYNLLLIEDAAQGIGGTYYGKKCGSLGDISTTSFFPSKPLGCYGDGGAVFTDDKRIYSLLKSLRVHGKGNSKYDNIHIGINSRLDELQAAILNVKLKYLPVEIEKRQELAENYELKLGNIVKTPYIMKDSVSAYAQYIIMTKGMEQRDALVRYLDGRNIPTIQYYPNPLHKLPVFNEIEVYSEKFVNACQYAERALGIPFSAFLDNEEQEFIIRTIKEYFEYGNLQEN